MQPLSRNADMVARRLAETTVAAAMSPGVLTAAPAEGLQELAATMARYAVHCLVVEGIGIVSDRALTAALAEGRPVTAEQLAADEVLTTPAATTLDEAVRVLVDHDASHLVVLEGGAPVGVLSTLDVARVAAGLG
jgi:CBS domain-containing protein